MRCISRLAAIGILTWASGCSARATPTRAEVVNRPDAAERDIDVLHEEIDCRTSVDGKAEVDRRCCEESPEAAGCAPS